MANTLTNFEPDIYAGLDVVSREIVGMIPAVGRDVSSERLAKDKLLRIHVAPAATTFDVTPGQLPADNGDQVFTSETMTIAKEKYAPVRWNGNEQIAVNNSAGYLNMRADAFAQAFRSLANEIDSDLTALYIRASRAIAPSGTTLFDAGLQDVANARRILVENGSPLSDMQLVLNHKAGAALRGLNQYAGANTAGTDSILRQGELLNTYGVSIRESAHIVTHTPGDYNGLAVNDAVEPIGETSISVDVAGGGGVLPGDVVSIEDSLGGDLYVVSTANADVDTGNIDINAPGLREASPGAVKLVLANTSNDRNMIFHRNAIQLATRLPALPEEGDSATDSMIVTDPVSGLSFEIRKYLEYKRVRYEVGIAWGVAAIKPEHMGILID